MTTWDTIFVSGPNIYFSTTFPGSGALCVWDGSSIQTRCIDYGGSNLENFIPMTQDIVFFGGQTGNQDDYFLMSSDFSNSNAMNWQKQISCPTFTCASNSSISRLSNDGNYIYTLIDFDDRSLFYALNSTNGNPAFSGLQRN